MSLSGISGGCKALAAGRRRKEFSMIGAINSTNKMLTNDREACEAGRTGDCQSRPPSRTLRIDTYAEGDSHHAAGD